MNFSGSLISIFSYHRAKENVKYFFSAWFLEHGLLVKNYQQWKTFRMIYNIAMFGRKKVVRRYQLWRHNILYLTCCLVFPAFWSHSVFLKIGQYTNSNLVIYSLSTFGKIIFVVTVNYDVISIYATRSLEKSRRTVFEIVSPTDNFETIKNGITLVARLLQ